ncbi:MAG: NAD(P)-dependent oxidoreductase [Rhizobacter sp.]
MTTVFVSHPQDKFDHYFGARALAALRDVADVRLNETPHELPLPALVDALDGCDALIAYRGTAGPEALFAQCPQLAVFLRCAIDIRTVDVLGASRHGVLVTQASAGFVAAVAEWVIASMVDLGRGISRYAAAYHAGWPLAPFMGRQLRGSTLGVVGHGQIGKAVCDIAEACGMTVLVTTPEPVAAHGSLRQVALPQLLNDSDFVVCLAPAKPETHHLFNAETFAAMRPGSFFINAARGELVDEAALLQALDGHLGGAALDVGMAADQMPSVALASHPKVVATPHIGGLTPPAVEHQSMETVTQLAALLRGEVPTGAVNTADATRLRRWPGFVHATATTAG